MTARPLVLVTRPGGETDPLVQALRTAGFEVAAVATVATRPVDDGGPLDTAAGRLESWDWVVLTSATGVLALAAAAARVGRAVVANRSDRVGAEEDRPRWAAVGAATAAALAAIGVQDAVVPASANGRAIAEALAGAGSLSGARVLLVRADAASPDLPAALRSFGAAVDEVVAYHTIECPPAAAVQLAELLVASTPAAVVIASGSAARGLVMTASRVGPTDRVLRLPVVAIGPTTAHVARSLGFERVHEAAEPSVAGLVAAVNDVVARHSIPLAARPDAERVEVPS